MFKNYIVPLLCFITFQLTAQVDGVYQFAETRPIVVLVDSVDDNILHLGTNSGYLRYNALTGEIEERMNATSQNPGLGRVIDIRQNPTDPSELAFAITGGFAILDDDGLNVFYHDNSDLTIAEGFADRFDLDYGNSGRLFITTPLSQSYQIYGDGVIIQEESTPFFPRGIVDNTTGTLRYMLTTQDGVYEFNVDTSDFTQYTSSNSNLIGDVTSDILIDDSDLVFVSTTSGISTIDGTGIIESYQDNTENFSVQDIAINSDGLVAGTLGTAFTPENRGFTLDVASNTWSVFVPSDNGCDVDEVSKLDISDDNTIYSVQTEFSSEPEPLLEIAVDDFSCSALAADPNNQFFFTIAGKQMQANDNGSVCILEFIKTGDNKLVSLDIDPSNFNGNFEDFKEYDVADDDAGFTFDYTSTENHAIVLRENGYEVIDIDFNTTLQFTPHNIPNFAADALLSAQSTDPNDANKAFFVIRGQDQVTNEFLLFKQECDFTTGLCSEAEELFDDNRDKSNSCTFGMDYHPEDDEVICTSAKFLDSGFGVTQESFDATTNGTPSTLYDGPFSQFPFNLRDPVIVDTYTVFLVSLQILVTFVDALTGNVQEAAQPLDIDGDGTDDRIVDVRSERFTNSDGLLLPVGTATTLNRDNPSNFIQMARVTNTAAAGENPVFEATTIPDARIDNNLPRGINVLSARLIQYNATTAMMVIETFNGILIKPNVNIDDAVLGLDEFANANDDIAIYPNPSVGLLNVFGNDIKQMSLYDLNGKQVSIPKAIHNQIDVSQLQTGMYILKVTLGNGEVRTKKIVRQ